MVEAKSPKLQIGKHLTFASNITVAQLQNDGDYDNNKTNPDKTTPDTVKSPTFKLKSSDVSLVASAHFGTGHQRKNTAHFVDQSES